MQKKWFSEFSPVLIYPAPLNNAFHIFQLSEKKNLQKDAGKSLIRESHSIVFKKEILKSEKRGLKRAQNINKFQGQITLKLWKRLHLYLFIRGNINNKKRPQLLFVMIYVTYISIWKKRRTNCYDDWAK